MEKVQSDSMPIFLSGNQALTHSTQYTCSFIAMLHRQFSLQLVTITIYPKATRRDFSIFESNLNRPTKGILTK